MRDFLNRQLGNDGINADDVINFLYNGNHDSRPEGQPNFDWRNVFNLTDQVLRLFNKYMEVRSFIRCIIMNMYCVRYFVTIFV